MSAWPLAGGPGVDRFQAAYSQIQSELKDILAQQRLEKDSLCRRSQRVSSCFRRRVLRTRLLSVASCQKTLVEVLQTQLHLEKTLVAAKAVLQAPPPAVRCNFVPRETMDHTPGEVSEERGGSCPNEEEEERGGPLSCPVTRGGEALPLFGQQRDRPSVCRKAPPSETLLQQVGVKGRNAASQGGAKDSSRPLCLLLQGGVMAPGSALQLLWKGKRHCARVSADGSIRSKGKVFQAPERWMEWIIGRNVPVGSAYALDRVTFRDVPLSQLLLKVEADENGPHPRPEASMDASAQPPHDAAGGLSFLLNIRTVHLVGDDEFMPSAVADRFWDQIPQKDFPESDGWDDLT